MLVHQALVQICFSWSASSSGLGRRIWFSSGRCLSVVSSWVRCPSREEVEHNRASGSEDSSTHLQMLRSSSPHPQPSRQSPSGCFLAVSSGATTRVPLRPVLRWARSPFREWFPPTHGRDGVLSIKGASTPSAPVPDDPPTCL